MSRFAALLPSLLTLLGLAVVAAAVGGLWGVWWAALVAGVSMVAVGERADW